jgi:aryl-alcohol dehydrogenase
VDQGHLLQGRTLTGVIEGDTVPGRFIPRLLELHAAGRFPFERLITTFPFADIGAAVDAARRGRVVKPVLVLDG